MRNILVILILRNDTGHRQDQIIVRTTFERHFGLGRFIVAALAVVSLGMGMMVRSITYMYIESYDTRKVPHCQKNGKESHVHISHHNMQMYKKCSKVKEICSTFVLQASNIAIGTNR